MLDLCIKKGKNRFFCNECYPHHEYATYLSTSRTIEVDEAISMISEMISPGYPVETRYCIDNLKALADIKASESRLDSILEQQN